MKRIFLFCGVLFFTSLHSMYSWDTENCENGFYATLDGLAWKGTAEGVEFAIVDNLMTFTQGLCISGTYKEPKVKYHPGVRVGLGYVIGERQWNIYGAYTGFNFTDCRNIAVNPATQVLIGTRSVAVINPIITNAQSNWNAKLNAVDLVIGRPIMIDNFAVFQPYAGFKALTLHHVRTVHYGGGFLTDAPINQCYKNNFNSFGLQTGLTMDFHLYGSPCNTCGDFSLYTNLAIALLAGKDTIKNREMYGAQLSTQTADCYQNVKFASDTGIGVRWKRDWKKATFLLNFAWELHRYPNIWGRQIVGTLASPIGIFTTQGFVFGAGMYF